MPIENNDVLGPWTTYEDNGNIYDYSSNSFKCSEPADLVISVNQKKWNSFSAKEKLDWLYKNNALTRSDMVEINLNVLDI
jgi:hypothetical protein